jgi:hypothetical protein
MKRLQLKDNPLDSYQFYSESTEGYCRNYPELTLHQVMRRLMRLVQDRLQTNIGVCI